MYRYFPTLVLCVVSTALCLSLHTALPVSAQGRAGVMERLQVFDEVWSAVNERYYDQRFNGQNWQALRDQYRPLAARTRNQTELYKLLKKMLSRLRDAHTKVYSPNERIDWQNTQVITMGISVREISGMAVITSVERDSQAQYSGIKVGDRIITVDGEPVQAIFTRLLEEQTSASTLISARSQAMSRVLDGPRDTTARIEVIGRDGARKTAELRREIRVTPPGITTRSLRDGILLLEINGFSDQIAYEFRKLARERIRKARAVIIDLRNNGGGEVDVMSEIASAFLPHGKPLGTFVDRRGRKVLDVQTTQANNLYSIQIHSPVVILTSERTASSAEIFADALKDSGRASIVGQTTCGCVLGLRNSETLSDGGELSISELDYRTTTGVRLEGKGVSPHHTISIDLSAVTESRDIVLERAMERILRERVSKNSRQIISKR
jgi:carboxyl-terminal processing protease